MAKENARHADARPARERPLAQLRDRPQAPGQGQGLHGRPDGSAGDVLPHQARATGRAARSASFGYGGGVIPRFTELKDDKGKPVFPDAAEFHTLRVQPPAGMHYNTDVLRKMSDIWETPRLGPDRLPRPVRRHHVPGRQDRQGAARLRRAQRARLRPGRRRPGGAHVDELRRRRALRAVLLRRGERAPYGYINTFPDDIHRPSLPRQVQIGASVSAIGSAVREPPPFSLDSFAARSRSRACT